MKRIISTVVCYNNDEEVIEYGRQLSAQSYAGNIVFLVTVNSAADIRKLAAELDRLQLESHLYETDTNLGYLNGCLYGVQHYDRIDADDCVIISNTDLSIPDSGVCQRIIDKMADTGVWCMGPSIRLKTGYYQNPFLYERPGSKKILMWKAVQGWAPSLVFYEELSAIKRNIREVPDKARSADVYAVHGSIFVLSADCIRKLLEAKRRIFMYGEEILIAEIVRQNHGIVRYADDIDIIHNENSTTGLTKARQKAKWYRESFGYLYNDFFRE